MRQQSKSNILQVSGLGAYVSVGLILIGCQRTDTDQVGTPSQAPPKAAEAPSTTAVPSKEAFRIRLGTEERYAAKRWQVFDVIVDAKEGWHLNKDFPTELTLVDPPSAVTFKKTTLGPSDALKFTEPQFHFQVPFMATAGRHVVKAKLAFAVCTPQTCVPEERTVELALYMTD